MGYGSKITPGVTWCVERTAHTKSNISERMGKRKTKQNAFNIDKGDLGELMLCPRSTDEVMLGWSIILTTLWARIPEAVY